MKERFSKVLLTGVLSVLLGASMSNLSADQVSWDRGSNYSYDNNYDHGANGCCYDFSNNCCCNDPRFSIAVDWLYWDICQEDADLAIIDQDSSTNTLGNAETKFFNYRYKSGFRVAASYHMQDCVSLDFVYTYFHPRHHNSITPPLGGGLLGSGILFPFATTSFNQASTAVKLKYDMYDLLLSKTIGCGECAKVRPYAGFRALVIQHQFDTDLTPTPLAGVVGPLGWRSQWRVKFPAYGFTLGAEGKWGLCGDISLIGRLGASLLGGSPEHHNEWLIGGTTTPALASLSQGEHRKHCQVISGWDGYIGFAYDTMCCCWPVDFAIGYEFQDWWNYPQRPRFVGIGQVTGDSASRLTLHGLFVRGGVSF